MPLAIKTKTFLFGPQFSLATFRSLKRRVSLYILHSLIDIYLLFKQGFYPFYAYFNLFVPQRFDRVKPRRLQSRV